MTISTWLENREGWQLWKVIQNPFPNTRHWLAKLALSALLASTSPAAAQETETRLAQVQAATTTDAPVSLLWPDGSVDILDQFWGTIANISPEFFRELFPQATDGFTQEQIRTFLDAFWWLGNDVWNRFREFWWFPPYLQRQTIQSVLSAIPENTRPNTGRLMSNVIWINWVEERLYRIANWVTDWLDYIILIEDDLRAFQRQYPVTYALIYTQEKREFLISMYEVYLSRIDSHVASLEATRDTMRWQAESLRWQAESLRWQAESLRWQAESLRWQAESLRMQIDFLRWLQSAT